MSEISVIGNSVVGTVRTTAPPAPPALAAAADAASSPLDCGVATTTDSVEFSEQAQLLEKIHSLPSIRQDRIDAIRDAIANETYLTNEKIDTALDRMIDEIAW